MKYIYICGLGRSGSSVFEKYLGNEINALSLGEATYAIERGGINNELCGCGNFYDVCNFWNSFHSTVCSGYSIEELTEISSDISTLESTVGYYTNSKSRKKSMLLKGYYRRFCDFLVNLDSSYIIDSSKRPVRAQILAEYLGTDNFYFIEFVREPAAVAYSWTKPKIRVEANKGQLSIMHQFGFFESILKWINVSIVSFFIRKKMKHKLIINYEDFVDKPQEIIERVKYFISYKAKSGEIEKYHAISGNPSRFNILKLEKDKRWENEVPFIKKIAVKIITIPFLLLNKL